MIINRDDIQTVSVDIMPMYIAATIDPASDRGSKIRSNDPQKRETLIMQLDDDSPEQMLAPSRFGALVDQFGNVLNTVTPKSYRLIPNAEIISALDLASDMVDMDLRPNDRGNYYKGRSRWSFITNNDFKVPGDSSPHFPQIDVWHDSRGTGGLAVRGGIYRQWCANGCTTQVLATSRTQTNHRKDTNLMEFFMHAVHELQTGMQRMMEIHKAAGETKANLREDSSIRRAVVQVYRDTAPRYRPRLSRMIRNYSDEVGPTVHALIQSVAEMATHDMQDGVSRHDWNHRASSVLVDALLEEVSI